ncbi:MAG: hypothetical protein LIP23_01055 [Planctomycetes bacterium]|nr:hypothetical protein [Planctomycetota bacterium]
MANYLDQIPKQLAARRKAFAAARDNPALLPSCWAIVRTIANNINEYNKNAVVGGCTFPDRPIYLSPDDAGFINFGTTPSLLRQDMAWLAAEANRSLPPEPGSTPDLTPEQEEEAGRKLSALVRSYGTNHHATRVYNLEAWLQEMYRDRLDVDFAEDLQRQIDAINAYMDTVPKSIQATGLNGKLAKGVQDAFNLFKTIIGSSHQLDREKMSFVDRRSYVNTIQKIETIMALADQSLGAVVAGKSVIRELFGLWKDANYELMKLTRQLRVLWAGTSLDDRIAELADLLGAVQRALGRCLEESRTPMPQLPVARADEQPSGLDRATITDSFHSVMLHDFIVGSDPSLTARETRRFGPLSVVIAAGTGQPRYCSEIRRLWPKDEENRKSVKTKPTERENDFDRRVKFPLNCLVVPNSADPAELQADMADAWLEFNNTVHPVQYKEVLDAAKNACPDAFLPPEGKELKDLPAAHSRHTLSRLTAAFVHWTKCGQEPGEEMPYFEPFKQLCLSRLDSSKFVVPVRYRPYLEMFSESGDKRRLEMWKRNLGPRFALDRQLVAVNMLQKDWKAMRRSLQFLPLSQIRGDINLTNAFAKTADSADPFAEHKAIALFRKFFAEQPDLKSALATVESQVSIEVETLRTQSESLGRVFQYDQAAATMMQRQASLIQEKRNAANQHIDQYLTGMMYALDDNYEAALLSLSMCLTPLAERQTDDIPPPPVPDTVGQEWFEENLKSQDGKFEKRKVPGEDSLGTVCYDYVYYNLGLVYVRLHRSIEARMSFHGVEQSTSPEKHHLIRLWASEHSQAEKAKMAEQEQKDNPAAETEKNGVAAKGATQAITQ